MKNLKNYLVLCLLFLITVNFVNAQKKATIKKKVSNVNSNENTIKDTFSYAFGVFEWGNLLRNKHTISTKEFYEGMNAAANKKELIKEDVAIAFLQRKMKEKLDSQSVLEKQKANAFFEKLKTNPKIKELRPGLFYEVIKDTVGLKPNDSSNVKVNYIGTLLDGTEFDNSFKRGQPAVFPINGVIKGWTEILKNMNAGSVYKVYMTSDWAYGDRGAGQVVPPGAALIFDIFFISIEK